MKANTDEQGRTIRLVMFDNNSGDVLRDIGKPPRKIRKTTTTKKRKKRAKAATKDDRIQLQIRIGVLMIENIDVAVAWNNHNMTDAAREKDGDETRTSFCSRAIARRLADEGSGDWQPGRTTASVLVGSRTPMLVRLDRNIMATMDVAAEAEGTTRTVWALDAFLSELALTRQAIEKASQEAA